MDQQAMRNFESMCIQNEAPFCVAACPLHVDVRGMNKAIQSGDLAGAAAIYRKSVPFPEFLSRVCNAPCENTCRLAEIGEGISIRAIENALITTCPAPVSSQRLPQKKQTVAVMGDTLDCLTAAHDLRRKGYNVVMFSQAAAGLTQSNRIPDAADFELIMDRLLALGVKVEPESQPGSLDRDRFSAFYFASESFESEINPETRMTNQEGVFSGGAAQEQWVESMADGRRAAISIDRFIQRVSLTASREKEGVYHSKLFTSLVDIAPSKSMLKNQPKAAMDSVIAEADRCILCECMECAKACEYIRYYNGSPRDYIRQIYNNLSICTGLRQKNRMINSCAVCGQCEAICPEGLPFQQVIQTARETMVETRKMPPSAFAFALDDLAFSNSDRFKLTRAPAGADHCKKAFFPGCQLPASSPAVTERLFDWLNVNLAEPVGLMLRCCGAIAEWAGDQDAMQDSMNDLRADWQALGEPELILSCPTCQKMINAYLPQIRTVSIWQYLAQHDSFAGIADQIPDQIFAIHDPCSAGLQPETRELVRTLAEKTGLKISELPYNGETATCCSYGGNMWNSNPELSRATVASRISDAPEDYLTYCAMCRDFFRKGGKSSWHLLDLLFNREEMMAGTAPQAPDYSQRHENRWRIKRNLLERVWNETMSDKEILSGYTLIISEAVRKQMEERMILVEDLKLILKQALESGVYMTNQQTGTHLAHATPSVVTYWVEYIPRGSEIEIVNAYSHRMFIKETP